MFRKMNTKTSLGSMPFVRFVPVSVCILMVINAIYSLESEYTHGQNMSLVVVLGFARMKQSVI